MREDELFIGIFGLKVYTFGLYVMIGAAFSMLALYLLGRTSVLKKGTLPLTALLSLLLGPVVSRLVFCLLNRELGRMMPLNTWFEVTGGGWSMFGLLGGVMLAGWLSAKIMKEKAGRILDILCISVLPAIIAERIAENRTEDFDISRAIDNKFLAKSFLAVGEDEPCLATYYFAAAAALALFVILLVRYAKRKEDGDVTISFLLLFGAVAIVTESLRYDRFLSISFVGLQQIFAAVMLAIGVIIAWTRGKRDKRTLGIIALISVPLAIGIVLGIEFALDRTVWNKILLYAVMIVTVAVPATLGHKLINGKGTQP